MGSSMKLPSWSTRSRRAVEVLERPRSGVELPGGGAAERDRDRVDREVAPEQILGQRRRDDVGQRARAGRRSRAGRGRCRSRTHRAARSRSRSGHGPSARPPSERRQGRRVAIDHEVEVERACRRAGGRAPRRRRGTRRGDPPDASAAARPPAAPAPALAAQGLGKTLRHRHSFFPSPSGRRMASMPAMPSSRRWLRWGLVAVVVLLVLAGGAVAFVLAHAPHNVSHPNVEFTDRQRPPRRRPKSPLPSTTSPGRAMGTTPRGRATTPAANPPEPPLHMGWRFQDLPCSSSPRSSTGTRST